MTTQKYQYLAGFIANLGVFGFGLLVAWISPYMLLLKSINTPLQSGPITDDESSWIVANICVGGLIGSFVFGKVSDLFGRKFSICSAAVPQIASWILILCGTQSIHLWTARILGGLTGGAAYATTPVYISEIAQDKIRGTLGSFLVLFSNIGTLIGYIMGTYLDYSIFPIIGLSLSIIFFIGMLFMPETPFYCMTIKQEEEAKKSLGFYRGIKSQKDQIESKEFQEELCVLQNRFEQVSNSGSSVSCADLTTQHARKTIMIIVVMVASTQLCGGFTVLSYASTIFQSSAAALNPNVSSILAVIPQVIGSYVSMMLVDRIGRKIMLLICIVANALSLITLGTYKYLQENDIDLSSINWLPILCTAITLTVAYSGIIPITYVVASEILPRKIVTTIISVSPMIPWSIGFCLLKFFPYIVETLHFYGCFWIFAGCSVFEAVFIYFLLPETKGKSFEEIAQLFTSK